MKKLFLFASILMMFVSWVACFSLPEGMGMVRFLLLLQALAWDVVSYVLVMDIVDVESKEKRERFSLLRAEE